jgi:hypothetical protein
LARREDCAVAAELHLKILVHLLARQAARDAVADRRGHDVEEGVSAPLVIFGDIVADSALSARERPTESLIAGTPGTGGARAP